MFKYSNKWNSDSDIVHVYGIEKTRIIDCFSTVFVFSMEIIVSVFSRRCCEAHEQFANAVFPDSEREHPKDWVRPKTQDVSAGMAATESKFPAAVRLETYEHDDIQYG